MLRKEVDTVVDRFEKFSYAIFEISRCWHKLATEVMAQYDLKGPYAIYLVTLLRSPEPMTAARLCELCGRDKADVSRALSVMEQQDLLLRQGPQYRACLCLTEKGQQLARQICSRASLAVELAGQGFSDNDREIFYQVLGTITDNLKTLSKNGLPEE